MPVILIVDDDSVDRRKAVRCLGPVEDLEILQADSGDRAVEELASGEPDLILTDLRMPGMNGLELVEHVHEEHPLVPMIVMTSQGSEHLAVQALEAGATSYVPKRDLPEHLPDTVRQVLDVAKARRSRRVVLRYLDVSETRFELANDPELILPLVGFFQDGLDRLAFGSPSLRTQVCMALMEAVSNAMIHGNLEVPSELREKSAEDYHRLIEERRRQEPYTARRVRCTAQESAGRVQYTIEDEGPGFDPAKLPDPTAPEHMGRLHGRGLLLIRTFMDEVEFNAPPRTP
jgi:CheY-like chemotaxis protein/anti-sigma regulatory factor (Ser/Thr protein kinase)